MQKDPTASLAAGVDNNTAPCENKQLGPHNGTAPLPPVVIIVGAGVSALSCGMHLQAAAAAQSESAQRQLGQQQQPQYDLDVILLEARDRIGGRVLSHVRI